MPTLITLGYAKCRGVQELSDMLGDERPDLLVDVRFSPMSRNPLWRSVATTEATVMRTNKVGAYQHVQGLGNPDYKSNKPATRIADPESLPYVVNPLLAGRTVAIMCYCPHTQKCHRRLIVDAVSQIVPDLTVVQLEAGTKEDPTWQTPAQ